LLEAGTEPRLSPLSDPVLVDLLVAAGADVDRPTSHGDRPLEIAAALGRTAVVKRLLAAGAQVTPAATAAATRRGWSGVQRLLAGRPGADLGEGQDAGTLASSPIGPVRVLDDHRVAALSYDALLVEWAADDRGQLVPSRWCDLDLNRVTWLEPEEPDLLLLAAEDEGVVEFDTARWGRRSGSEGSSDWEQPGRGPSDRGGVRQVLARPPDQPGGRLTLPAGRPSPWVMQAAAAADGVLLVREGAVLAENPQLDLLWLSQGATDPHRPDRTWTVPGVEAFVPVGLAVGSGGQIAALHHVTPSEAAVALVDLAGPVLRAVVPVGGPTTTLPHLQSAAALDRGRFAVIDEGNLVVVSAGPAPPAAVGRFRPDADVTSLAVARGLAAIGTTAGLRLVPAAELEAIDR
jgi:hypothetical protein